MLGAVTFTWQGDTIRVISFRPASKAEQRIHAKKPGRISQEDWEAVDFPEIPEAKLRATMPQREKPELLEVRRPGMG